MKITLRFVCVSCTSTSFLSLIRKLVIDSSYSLSSILSSLLLSEVIKYCLHKFLRLNLTKNLQNEETYILNVSSKFSVDLKRVFAHSLLPQNQDIWLITRKYPKYSSIWIQACPNHFHQSLHHLSLIYISKKWAKFLELDRLQLSKGTLISPEFTCNK